MRLINVETLQLEDFAGQQPGYAILSHTWGVDEVTYDDMVAKSNLHKSGWVKIQHICRQAYEDGTKYVWVDTCCINKSSSAELSESINSMYRWYRGAKICYAYLEDVDNVHDFDKARWFSRGWTLQELLAPQELVFYGSGWQRLGTRVDTAFYICLASKVDWEALFGLESQAHIRNSSIAKRMAWAASRCTTREEDLAYCLLGLFEVNMPLLYGEGGSKAFQRLQQEIIRQTLDHSFLVWIWHQYLGSWSAGDIDFLASHPRCFTGCEMITTSDQNVFPFALNNQGLQVRLPLYQVPDQTAHHVAVLACVHEGVMKRVGLLLKAIDDSKGIFLREKHVEVCTIPEHIAQQAVLREFCILRQLRPSKRVLWIHTSSYPASSRDAELAGHMFLWHREMLYCTQHGSWKSFKSRRKRIELPNEEAARSTTFGITFSHPHPRTSTPEGSEDLEAICKLLIRIDFADIEKTWSSNTAKISVHEYWDGVHDENHTLAKVLSIPESAIPSSYHATAQTGVDRDHILHAIISWESIADEHALVLDINIIKGTVDTSST
jgi:hypothetical protein